MSNDLVRLALARKNTRHSNGYVHKLRDASTREAAELMIIKPLKKLMQGESFSIGGTRTEARPDFWFHFTTSHYAQTYLLNLFVTVSWRGRYYVKYIRNSKLLLKVDNTREIFGLSVGYGDLQERFFKTERNNEHVYLTTYQFNAKDLETCETLIIPFAIKDTMAMALTNYYHRRHMAAKLQSSDFEIISSTGVKYQIHAAALEEHSPIILGRFVRRALNMSQRHLILDISDPDMAALKEFIYLDDIFTSIDYLDIVKLAGKFGLIKLYEWVVQKFCEHFSYANAYEITRLAVRYKWKEILQLMFEYIEYSPEILHTFGVNDEYDKKILTVFLKYLYCGENFKSFFKPVFVRRIHISIGYLRNYE